jgi:hypothetical protein
MPHRLLELQPRHHAAIRMCIEGRSTEQISRALEVKPRTLYIWFSDPLVKRELAEQLQRFNEIFAERYAAVCLAAIDVDPTCSVSRAAAHMQVRGSRPRRSQDAWRSSCASPATCARARLRRGEPPGSTGAGSGARAVACRATAERVRVPAADSTGRGFFSSGKLSLAASESYGSSTACRRQT